MDFSKYKHIQLTNRSGVVWAELDHKKHSTNVLDEDLLNEIDKLITEIRNEAVKAFVITTAKSGFIAGADIKQFSNVTSCEEGLNLINKGQQIIQKLEDLECVTICLIKGFCLGGGLELALACNYRLVVEETAAKIGLPEVMLGIHPGWGGTVRLPKLIGPLKALELMVSGRIISARQAKKNGIITNVVPERCIARAIEHFVKSKPNKIKISIINKFCGHDIIRPLVAKFFTKKTQERIDKLHYPAPFAIIDNWLETSVYKANAYANEAKSVAQLITSYTSKNLTRVFLLREQLKNLSKKDEYSFTHVHVIGAGIMGGDIAAWCALQGFNVTLQDTNLSAISNSFARAKKLFDKKFKASHLVKSVQDRMLPDINGQGVSSADVIIEAVVEDLAVKQQIFAEVMKRAKSNAILATNTSTIPLKMISEKLSDPTRIVGIHFFNPVAKMPLVELVYDTNTPDKLIDKVANFIGKLDKLPLKVKSAPGFLVNRILVPYLVESVEMLEEGIDPKIIDCAAVRFGMPLGPLTLADTVGIDICLAAANQLQIKIPEKLQKLVKQGNLGIKTGKGIFEYENGKKINRKLPANEYIPQDITDRLIFRILNESGACLRENIVDNADLLDAGMIFGAGFAPFTGGPINYFNSQPADTMQKRFAELEKTYGDRFAADPGLPV